jgi:hypothetical protein
MTIDEMIAELSRRREMHGGGTVVRCTWESVVQEILPENIYYTGENDPWGAGLWIDADDNSYRPDTAI